MKTNSITEALQYITDDQSSSFDASPAFAELDQLLDSHAALVGALDNARKAMEMARQMGQFPDCCLEAIKDTRAALALAGKVEVLP